MVRERSSEINIPLDLKLEILKKLPAKSFVRFICVSKLWKTIIREYMIKDSIVLRSLTQPSRDPHFVLQRVHKSSSLSENLRTYSFAYYHHQTTHEEEEQLGSLEETSRDSYCIPNFQYVHGLIGYEYEVTPYSCHQFIIHNPTTRQIVSLPKTVHTSKHYTSSFFFGYDPLSNQYKVVYWCLERKQTCQVYTLGDLENQWRNIPCWIERHYPYRHKICINGVIYYKAMRAVKDIGFVVVSFDLGFERFNHVQTPKELSICLGDAIFLNYQGKLGCICKDKLDLNLWVLENAERQEWSEVKYVDVLRDLPISFNVRFAGITYPGDEIVFGGQSKPRELAPTVYYYDRKLKKIRKVEIKTTIPFRDRIFISNVVTDHVDNIMSLS